MSDRQLRELERRWNESGSSEDRKALDRARVRSGLSKLPRLVIRHYIAHQHHGNCGPDGLIDLVFNSPSGNSWPVQTHRVHAACSVELWPRNLVAAHRGWDQSMKKNIYYTEDPDDVTCKTCIKSINKPDKRVYKRSHYAPGSKQPTRGSEVNEVVARPVCGRDDGARFEESFSYDMRTVNCPACKRVMARGRRRARAPRSR